MNLQKYNIILFELCIIFFFLSRTLMAVESFSTPQGLTGTKANLFNGSISEHISTTIYKKNGYSQLDAEVGRNGVDGLFVTRDSSGNIKEAVFSEVKHGDGKLGTIQNGTIKQMSKEWKIIKIDEKINSLNRNSIPSKAEEKLIFELKEIKKMIEQDKVKSQITRITNIGDNKFSISINELNEDGTIGKQLKHKMNDTIIDLKQNYPVHSNEWKLKKIMSHSVRKEKRLLEETAKLKTLKDPKEIINQKAKIELIKKSRPDIFNVANNTAKSINQTKKASSDLSKGVSAVYLTKGKKTLAFVEAKSLKGLAQFQNLKFIKKAKGGDVIMVALESGVAVYSLVSGNMSFQKAAQLLLENNAKTIISQGFSKGLIFLTPPPATLVAILSITGAFAAEYAIDKYIELDKRNYIGLEDMLWDVPDEIKNKITVLNPEDTKRDTVFDFSNIDKETILDDEHAGETVLDNEDIEKETILDI